MRFSFKPADIVRIVKQRLFWFLIPFSAIAIVGLAIIGRLPPLYESSATLLVQSQQVPDSFVQSTIQSEAVERLQTVRAELLARDNLIRLGEKHGVFAGQQLTFGEKGDLMRDRARIGISAGGNRRNRDDTVILTEIAFTDEQPRRAQAVANDMMTQFLTGTVELRREQAGQTTGFLQEEERKVRRSIDQLTQRISAIKAENPDALPDNRNLYEGTLQRLLIDQARNEASLEQIQSDVQQLEMQRPLMEAQQSPRQQELAALRNDLSAMRRQYTDSYPGVVAMKQQVLDLEYELEPEAFRRSARREIDELSRELADQRRGTSEYAETEERIAELRERLANVPSAPVTANPGEVSYAGQRFALESRAAMLQRQGEDIARQIADMEERIGSLPAVETQLYALTEEQARLERDLSRLQADRATAERSLALELQAKAERVTPIDPPSAPEEPTSPDKPKLALGVFFVAGALAGLLVLLPEILFAKVQSKDHLKELLPDVPVVEVPRFKTADERTPRLVATASLTATTLVLGAALSWTAYQTLL